MEKIRVSYKEIVNHNNVPTFRKNPSNEDEWLVAVPWDLDVESREGIHCVTVRKKGAGRTSVYLKEKVFEDEYESFWRIYGWDEIDFYKPEEAEEAE